MTYKKRKPDRCPGPNSLDFPDFLDYHFRVPMNSLYYGDNLKILRDYIKDESVDLIYLDPPFNSNRNYNVLFRNEAGTEAESQITAFEDTWHWNLSAEQTFNELINEPDQTGRMIESFRQFIGQAYKVVGQPEDLEGAKELAEKDKYGFQWWILPLIGAKAYGSEAGKKEGKKGADRGIDGELVFIDDNSGKAKRVIVSVKGGGVNVSQIRDLGHVIERENAAIGVFLTLEKPSKPTLQEAAEKGFYHSPGWNKDYPRLQILTVEDILAGKNVDLPPNLQTFTTARRDTSDSSPQDSLF